MLIARAILPIVGITIALWCVADAAVTNALHIRGLAQFLTSSYPTGHVNKPGFSGFFGGPLDGFYSRVSIDLRGFRTSDRCLAKGSESTVIFIGDSGTAGFEVGDSATFVSLLNASCRAHGWMGINAGVRAYDTHQALLHYRDIAANTRHDRVVYIISTNDLYENLFEYHYPTIVQTFGRGRLGDAGEVLYTEPASDSLMRTYLQLRIFIADNFYFTGRLVQRLRNGRRVDAAETVPGGIEQEAHDKLLKLLRMTASTARKAGARLAVAPYPCLIPNVDACRSIANLERLIILHGRADGYDAIPLDLLTRQWTAENNVPLEELRFASDLHLSPTGHKAVHAIMRAELSRLASKGRDAASASDSRQ